MKNHIYADHAATTPLMPEVLEAMLPFLKEDFGNPSSLHGWAKPARMAVEDARATIAKCINAEPEEIFFTSGGTEADNWVIKGSSGGLMVSSYEHHAVPGHSAEGLLHVLDLKGIAVSTGAACDSKNTQISHVLKAVNVTNEIARSTIRITLGAENTVDDVHVILAALKTVLLA